VADYVTRQARWVDFDNDYKTLDLDYMESVMWALKTLWDKGLIYEGFRVLAYCWRCETPLSNTETRMDDVYRDRQDPALTVWFQLETGERMLAWTTTPWTLPANLALAVGPDIEYAVVEEDGERYVLAASRLAPTRRSSGATQVGTLMGSDLVGRRYEPMFDYFADRERFGTEDAFQVLGADFVSTEDGTGVVHMAPGFGEEDQIACNAAGIPTLCPMDEHGQYTAEVRDWVGQHVFDANPHVIRHLKDQGVVVRHDTYDHSYPHCWRCRPAARLPGDLVVVRQGDRVPGPDGRAQPADHLGPRARQGRVVRQVARERPRLGDQPEPLLGVTDPGLEERRPEVPADRRVRLARRARARLRCAGDRPPPPGGRRARPAEPRRPDGRSMMRRVPEVLDCWFESGSMPFAQVHYPFENAEWFEHHYPGDFIVEYIGQTRGWFYTMHVLATALFDRPAFSSCVSHGIVLGDDGRKMSKSLSNYPDPNEMFDVYGADAMRWYLLSSPILRGADFSVTETGMRDTVRHVILPYWNAYYFLTLYANAADTVGRFRTDQTDVLDRYLLGELRGLVESVTERMDVYDLFGACESVATFLDTLTNWYIRRSRDRFWDGEQDAVDTLHTALVTLSQVAAPLLPLVTEHVHAGLTAEERRERASHRLADRRGVPVRRRAPRRDGTGPRRLLDAAVAPQGGGIARPTAAREGRRRVPGRRSAGRAHRHPPRRAERQVGRADDRRRRVRLEGAGPQPEDAGPPARRSDPGGHPGPQGGRLDGRR
jgi:isoleucyl-tRNA synthetase